MSQKIYITVNKSGKPLMFVDEPQRTEKSWVGNFYVNSVLYEQVCELIKQSGMKFEDDPEILEFQINAQSNAE